MEGDPAKLLTIINQIVTNRGLAAVTSVNLDNVES